MGTVVTAGGTAAAAGGAAFTLARLAQVAGPVANDVGRIAASIVLAIGGTIAAAGEAEK